MDKLTKAIEKEKKKLIAKADRRGLYENFGQTEVGKLEDTFHYQDLVYGIPEERAQAKQIADFQEWCYNYEGGKK